MVSFALPDYFEDDAGNGISETEIARVVTGNDNVIAVPAGMREDEIRLRFGGYRSLSESELSGITLEQVEVDALANFLRETTELEQCEFLKSPPIFDSTVGLRSVGSEYIGAFVQIWRRLYLHDHRGNFKNTCMIYARRFPNKNLADWVTQERKQYHRFLRARAAFFQGVKPEFSFANETLIKAFLYTKFVHQPTADSIADYDQAVREVGNADRVEFAFYMALWHLAVQFTNVARLIRKDVENYFALSGARPSFDPSPFVDTRGRGAELTAQQQRENALKKRAEKLGEELWIGAGIPADRLPQFLEDARRMLSDHSAT
ncbi:MAG: hypothetical protein ABIK89_14460 [Planctomycetota bacterium]